jgi:hypothetical protein
MSYNVLRHKNKNKQECLSLTGVFVLIIVVDVIKRFTALQEKQARVFAECRKTFYIITNLNKLECLSFTCVIIHCQCHKNTKYHYKIN